MTCQLARGRGKSALPGFLLQFQLPQDLGVTWGVTGVGVLVEEQELRITEDEPPSERAVTLGLLR